MGLPTMFATRRASAVQTRSPSSTAPLERLEHELRGNDTLDRRLAHRLHRLALESQVLLTDAWPGVFDEAVIQAIRTVQEAVERILSGQDIRYYPAAHPESERTLERPSMARQPGEARSR